MMRLRILGPRERDQRERDEKPGIVLGYGPTGHRDGHTQEVKVSVLEELVGDQWVEVNTGAF